jgi:hypothetical protein
LNKICLHHLKIDPDILVILKYWLLGSLYLEWLIRPVLLYDGHLKRQFLHLEIILLSLSRNTNTLAKVLHVIFLDFLKRHSLDPIDLLVSLRFPSLLIEISH